MQDMMRILRAKAEHDPPLISLAVAVRSLKWSSSVL
jgi:hypothetical protein